MLIDIELQFEILNLSSLKLFIIVSYFFLFMYFAYDLYLTVNVDRPIYYCRWGATLQFRVSCNSDSIL